MSSLKVVEISSPTSSTKSVPVRWRAAAEKNVENSTPVRPQQLPLTEDNLRGFRSSPLLKVPKVKSPGVTRYARSIMVTPLRALSLNG